MTRRKMEIGAYVATLLCFLAATVWPFVHEARSEHQKLPPGARVITLTAVAASGTWTEAAVNGMNYWRTDFAPARPLVRVGETFVLRLKSSDVVHTFYAPQLGIGPVEVYPGNVAKVVVTPKQAGTYRYYCTTFCGDPHFGMRGEIVVRGQGEPEPKTVSPRAEPYWLASEPPPGARAVERGKWLFHRRGCVTCHGEEGKGGVANFNYVKTTVPALNALAERMMLDDPEDAKAVVAVLDGGASLDSVESKPPVPRFNVVLAQYRSIRDKIKEGSPSAKQDVQGPEPPLQMPSWRARLSDRDIDAVIAYLLSLPPPSE